MDYEYAYNAYGVVCTEVEIDVLTGQPQLTSSMTVETGELTDAAAAKHRHTCKA